MSIVHSNDEKKAYIREVASCAYILVHNGRLVMSDNCLSYIKQEYDKIVKDKPKELKAGDEIKPIYCNVDGAMDITEIKGE